MGFRVSRVFWAGIAAATVLVFREVRERAVLLARLATDRDPIDLVTEDQLAAYAEPVSLPEPLLRSKAG